MTPWTGVGGKRVVITGATNGIGLAAAKELAQRGAELTVVGRSAERARAAAEQIAAAADAARGSRAIGVDVVNADLSLQTSIRELAAELLARYPRIDVLINNAGAVFTSRGVTQEGIERTWALNHLAPFLLTELLLPRLKESAPSRIITTSSDAHRAGRIPFDDLNADRSYGQLGFERYSASKLANILFTRELARRLEDTGVTANCCHPGFVASGFNRNNGFLMRFGMTLARPFARSVEKGAETLVWLADSPDVANESGGYFYDCRRIKPTNAAQDDDVARRLWQLSEAQTRESSRSLS